MIFWTTIKQWVAVNIVDSAVLTGILSQFNILPSQRSLNKVSTNEVSHLNTCLISYLFLSLGYREWGLHTLVTGGPIVRISHSLIFSLSCLSFIKSMCCNHWFPPSRMHRDLMGLWKYRYKIFIDIFWRNRTVSSHCVRKQFN